MATGQTLEQRLVDAERCCTDNEEAIAQLELGALATFPRLVSWYDDADWDQFTEVPVGDSSDGAPDNTLTLTGSDGIGTVQASGGTHGNDRRLYLLDAELTPSDVEVYADFTLDDAGAQFGLAVRADEAEAVIVWNNIFFGLSGTLLQGVWEYDGVSLISTNQAANSIGVASDTILSAEGDGSTVTVQTRVPHLLQVGQFVIVSFGPYTPDAQFMISAIPDAVTFEFSDTEVFGPITDGIWALNTVYPVGLRRRMAMRMIGDLVVFKQWRPYEAEPNWADPLRSQWNFLPSSLIGSGLPPPTSGRVGIVVAHLGSTRSLQVNDLTVTPIS